MAMGREILMEKDMAFLPILSDNMVLQTEFEC